MGSSTSKPNASESYGPSASAASSGSGLRRSRCKGSRVFQSSCLSGSHDSENDDPQPQVEENNPVDPCPNQAKTDSDRDEYDKTGKVEHNEVACISTSDELDEWSQSRLTDVVSRSDSTSSRAFFSRSLDPPNRFLSRFSFFPGNISFRLSRATSLGSSRAFPPSSSSFTISNDDEELDTHTGPTIGLVDRNEIGRGCDLLPAGLISRSPRPHYDNVASCDMHSATSAFPNNLVDEQIPCVQDVARDVDNDRVEINLSLRSPGSYTGVEAMEMTFADPRTAVGGREPVGRNVRFSRTLSVGRLRDRVLRRSSFPESTDCPLWQEREVRIANQANRRQALGGGMEAPLSNENVSISSSSSYVPSSVSSSVFNSQDYEVGARAREARYHDLLEHRSNFLERRRRIRSQVRALQRLGGRFENLSGHERSCILSGQYRAGHCTCRSSTRDANLNDETSARASISRIVMLAEALFEVLDEIHQQSVVLSARSSLSSIGSAPAPREVVESLPLKLYSKLQTHMNDEAAQCYICLVEYEDEDSVRILPCQHEFHKLCIDKWLKEIHRVCPLCRRNVCRSDLTLVEN